MIDADKKYVSSVFLRLFFIYLRVNDRCRQKQCVVCFLCVFLNHSFQSFAAAYSDFFSLFITNMDRRYNSIVCLSMLSCPFYTIVYDA